MALDTITGTLNPYTIPREILERIGVIEGDITTIEGDITTIEGDIDNLEDILPASSFSENSTVADAISNINGDITSIETALDKTAYGYETVSDMQDDTSLTAGMIAHTNGFHASGDGGASWYVISASATANGMDVIALDNGAFATLVIETNVIKMRQLGAQDNVDATGIVNRAISIIEANYPVSNFAGDRKTGGGVVYFNSGNYVLSTLIDLDNKNCLSFIGENKDTTVINGGFICDDGTSHQHDIAFENLTFTGSNTAINLIRPANLKIKNCNFYNIDTVDTFAVLLYLTVGCLIEECQFYNCSTGVYVSGTAGSGAYTTLTVNKCWFSHCATGFTCAFSSGSNYFTGYIIKNCIFEYCTTRALNIQANTNNASDIRFENIYLEGNSNGSQFNNVAGIAEFSHFDDTEPALSVTGTFNSFIIENGKSSNKTNNLIIVYRNGNIRDFKNRKWYFKNVASIALTTIANNINGLLVYNSSSGSYIGTLEFENGVSNTITKIAGGLTPTKNVYGTVTFNESGNYEIYY